MLVRRSYLCKFTRNIVTKNTHCLGTEKLISKIFIAKCSLPPLKSFFNKIQTTVKIISKITGEM